MFHTGSYSTAWGPNDGFLKRGITIDSLRVDGLSPVLRELIIGHSKSTMPALATLLSPKGQGSCAREVGLTPPRIHINCKVYTMGQVGHSCTSVSTTQSAIPCVCHRFCQQSSWQTDHSMFPSAVIQLRRDSGAIIPSLFGNVLLVTTVLKQWQNTFFLPSSSPLCRPDSSRLWQMFNQTPCSSSCSIILVDTHVSTLSGSSLGNQGALQAPFTRR